MRRKKNNWEVYKKKKEAIKQLLSENMPISKIALFLIIGRKNKKNTLNSSLFWASRVI